MSGMQNWAGNLTYNSTKVEAPSTVEELQSIVAKQSKVKALGTRHSFNEIADTDAVQISTENLNQVLAIDHKASMVTIQGGIKYGDLAVALEKEKLALHNLASLPHISVAGACATATHGSGLNNKSLSSAVVALNLVTADGSLKTYKKGDSEFEGVVVNLGALGVVANITLKVQPTYKMTQWVYENLDLETIEDYLVEVLGAGYSVSLFTRWKSAGFDQVWIKQLADSQRSWDDFYGAKPAPENRHPIPGISAANCTMQLGVPGAWYERLPHFKMNFTPSSGEELQTEYLIPLQHAHEALTAISDMREQISPLLLTSEIRTVAADDLWMSPFYRQPSMGIHFTWQPKWAEVKAILPSIEAALQPFEPKPHWGKLFTMPSSDFLPKYAKLNDFLVLRDQLDPNRKFANAFLETNLKIV